MGSSATGSPAIPISAPASTARRLAALWIADIVGYTRLSAQNENAALKVIDAFQHLVRQEVERFGGRVVKFLGDGALADFPRADAAVR